MALSVQPGSADFQLLSVVNYIRKDLVVLQLQDSVICLQFSEMAI